MNPAPVVALLIVLVVILVGALIFTTVRKRRRERLRERFRPQYDRMVRRRGSAKKAEPILAFRQQRDSFRIRTLSPTDRSSFRYRWNEVQARFFDDPPAAVKLADGFVTDVMQASGYPIADFDEQAAKLSVDHAFVVENYRQAHEIALRLDRGQASTEDLASAMVHFRWLFHELIDEPQIHKKGA